MHHVPQYFLIWFHFAPQTGKLAIAPPNPTTDTLRGTIESRGTIGCWCQKPAHGEIGQCRWRLGWWRLILVVVCCVLCVVVVTSFSYLIDRKAKIGPAKMANFSALITKHLLCVGWRNLFPVVLLCRVSFWFWREIGFGLHTHGLRVQYSCGVVLVFWLRREIVFGVTYILSVQFSCAVVSVFWL